LPRKLSWDKSLFTVTTLLVVSGLLMVYSSSAVIAMQDYGTPFTFLGKQLVFGGLGFLLMIVLMNIPYQVFHRKDVVYGLLLVVLGLLVAVLVFPPQHHAHRWLKLGLFSFQPSELGKISLVVFMAHQLSRKKDRVNDFFGTLFPCLLVFCQVAFLILIEPDLGTVVMMAVIALVMFFVAGLRLRYVYGLIMLAAPVFYFAVVRVPYRLKRVLIFLDPWSDPLGSGFQTIQSLIAVGTGGLFGLGPGQGKQKLFFLPEPHTDFIFAVCAEELGFIGGASLILLFSIYFFCGIKTAVRAPSVFGSLLAVGLTTMITFQAFINIGVVIGLFPTKGLPLPFISAGGSSLVMSLAATGIILGVSREAR